jgi:uncharacterized protein (TIGR02145 family)
MAGELCTQVIGASIHARTCDQNMNLQCTCGANSRYLSAVEARRRNFANKWPDLLCRCTYKQNLHTRKYCSNLIPGYYNIRLKSGNLYLVVLNTGLAYYRSIFLAGVLCCLFLTSARAQFSEGMMMADTTFTFKDGRDGKEYTAVRINGQIWLAENLRYNTKDSRCYDNTKNSCKKYGRLYSWHEAVNACPKGWHLPTGAEWQQLINFCGGEKFAGRTLAYDNQLGFQIVFGYPPNVNGRFSNEDTQAHFWTADQNNISTAFVVYFIKDKLPLVYINYFSKNYGMMCRCVKDNSEID